MPSGLFYLNTLDRIISDRKGVREILLPCFIETSVFNANGIDPDQTVSDLSLHCLPISLLWDARHKRVNGVFAERTVSEEIFFHASHSVFITL